jgi:predicted signal transduction protein with EAL and GGDEF domain
VSASFGIASTATSGYDLRQLLAHADSALYTAKRAGRNRVAVYDTSVAIMGINTTGSDPALKPAAETAPAADGAPKMTDVRILGITGS